MVKRVNWRLSQLTSQCHRADHVAWSLAIAWRLRGKMKRAQNKGSEALGLTFIPFFPFSPFFPSSNIYWESIIGTLRQFISLGWQSSEGDKKAMAVTVLCGRCHHVAGTQYCGGLQRDWFALAYHPTFSFLYNYMYSSFFMRLLWGSKEATICYKVLWIVLANIDSYR